MATFQSTKRAFARERIRFTNGGIGVLTAATYLDTATVPGGSRRPATGARIALDIAAGDIHFTEEGTTPTTATDNTGVGTPATARDVIYLESLQAIMNFKAIALTATNADADITYYK